MSLYKSMTLILSGLAFTVSGASANEKSFMDLLNVPVVTEKLSDARAADILRKNCDGVSARLLYAYSEARKLKGHAASLGYSDQEIDLFLKSKDAKSVIYKMADDKLKALNVQELGACQVASHQISSRTYIGSFLKE